MNTWNISDPPKDGARIVAFGRVIYSDAFSTCVEPFSAKIISWENFDSGHAGWMHNGLSIKEDLADEVKIDYWMPMPSTQFDPMNRSHVTGGTSDATNER